MPIQAMEGVAMVVGVWQFPATAATLLYQETIPSVFPFRLALGLLGKSCNFLWPHFFFQTANICTLYFNHNFRSLYRNHFPM